MAGRKVFQAATVLTAADVNNFLMDQSVMVFANSAARASAIGTPTAGMVSYLEDTSALQVYGTAWAAVSNPGDITAVTAGSGLTGGGVSGDVTLNVNFAQVIPTNTVTAAGDLIVANGSATVTRLGIGTNGQVLSSNGTTATWASPATGGAALLSTTTLSGATTTISSIDQTYNDLRIEIIGATSSSASYKLIEYKNGSSALPCRTWMVNASNSTNFRQVQNYVEFTRGYDSATLEAFITIPSYSASQAHAIQQISHMADGDVPNYAWGFTESNSVINAITLDSGGTWTAGTVKIWGIK